MVTKPGLLVISEKNVANLKELLNSANDSKVERLYVRLSLPRTDALTSQIYLLSAAICPKIDVRILSKLSTPEDYILIGDEQPEKSENPPTKKYKKVVLGGTFDRLHNGHKVLLDKAVELASELIVVGVTDREMIIKKSLCEMIQSVEFRMQKVVDFVEDVSGEAKCHTEPIIDPYGPSTRIPDLEAIIVSRETVKGGDAVNKKRLENGMSQLDVIVVELVEGSDEILKETKISSSSRRREDLGRLLIPVLYLEKPYYINLIGEKDSKREEIGRYLNEKEDVEVINADLQPDRYLEFKEKSVPKAKVTVIFSNDNLDIVCNEHWRAFEPSNPPDVLYRLADTISFRRQNDKAAGKISESYAALHVAFYAHWNEEETRKQVDRAVEELMKRV